jgi:hypothetical protein
VNRRSEHPSQSRSQQNSALENAGRPSRDNGIGAPSRQRPLARLGILSIVSVLAALAFAATASAAEPPSSELKSVTAGYSTAHVEAVVEPNATEANICWQFQYGEKEQIDKAPSVQEEYWQGGNYECFYAEKDEPFPLKFDNAGIRSSETWYARLYTANGGEISYSPRLVFQTTHVNDPISTIDSVVEVTTNSATFTGSVNPNAPKKASEMTDEEEKEAYRTNFEFRCEPGCNVYECNPAPCGPQGNGGQLNAENSDMVSPVTFTGKANNLEANRTYTVYMNAQNSQSDYYDYLTKAGKMTFKTLPLPPAVTYLESAPVNTVRTTSARLVGLIDKKNSPLTDCHFEYGTTTSYGTVLPCVPRDNARLVSADLDGLQPGTTYHFRLVAGNAVGSDEGDDRSFTTLEPVPPPPNCANQAIRVEQRATMTGSCRAWEMVSPIDKNGGNITLENGAAAAAATGDGIVYYSRGSFADTEGSGVIGVTEYVAHRGPSGWETHAILPTPASETTQTGFFPGNTVVEQFNEDMTKGLLDAYDLPKVPDDIPTAMNIYIVNTTTRDTVTISKPVPGEEEGFGRKLEYNFTIFESGASADLSLISFPSRTKLLPEAPEGQTSIYEFEVGVPLRLASILPNGQPATSGVENPIRGFTSVEAISRNGALVSFMASEESGPQQLYVRRHHTDTVWVSEPEGSDKSVPQSVKFEYITPDSKHILFNTTAALLDEDTNGNWDLYMYTDSPNPTSEPNLKLISTGGTEDPGGGEVGGGGVNPGEAVIGTSDDGSVVYYQDMKWNIGQILQYKNGQRRVIFFPYGSDVASGQLRGLRDDPGTMRVSSDGKRLAMITGAGPEVLGEGYGLNGLLTGHKRELWVYDDDTETTICASCPDTPPGGTEKVPRSDTTVIPEVLKGINIQFTLMNRPRYLSRDGKLAFFSTAEKLLPEDINGIMDVYEFDTTTGHLRLVSSGQGEWGSWFVDASASGDDVFIGTREKLIAADTDTLADIYDARRNGGYAEPPPPPTACVGDGCRGPIGTAPVDPSPATPRFAGPGDPAPKHAKKKKRKTRKGKRGKGRHKRGDRKQGGAR